MNIGEAFHNLRNQEKEDFIRVANRLLSTTFITRKNEQNKKDYYFLERHYELMREYFSLSGWELIHDRPLGVFQLVNTYGFNREKLKMEESIILLIIRLCYEEKKRTELSLAENVLLTTRDIQERYLALKIREKPLDRKVIRETINMLKRYNILQNLDSDPADPDCRLEIFPSLLLAVRVEDIKELYDKLAAYGSGESGIPSGGEEPA
ncbi:DUF4194 domain-containing protein [Zhaonella formicivorans]|uniref:DUF4194 domain-containing protein n=1 Tax=Zhaonella formicivorans TaxID=2528593 RepID=UPI0010D037C6|nr:DUF4194 domain-containing protein [Zhaonella formicivorans]